MSPVSLSTFPNDIFPLVNFTNVFQIHGLVEQVLLWLNNGNDSWVFFINLFHFFVNMSKKPIRNLVLCCEIFDQVSNGGTLNQTDVFLDAVNLRVDRHMRNHEIKSSSVNINLYFRSWKTSYESIKNQFRFIRVIKEEIVV